MPGDDETEAELNPGEELAPCLLCGEPPAANVAVRKFGDDVRRMFTVECLGCYATTAAHETLREAVREWNEKNLPM